MAFSLDYPGVGPEHSFLKDVGRAEYYSVTDDEALEGMLYASLIPSIVLPLGIEYFLIFSAQACDPFLP